MGDFGPPFFMKYLLHPLTITNILICGFLGVVQIVHTQAHYEMKVDVDSYVTSFLKKNPKFLEKNCN